MLCISGVVDDVMLSYNGVNRAESIRCYACSSSPGGGNSRQQRRAHRRRSLLSPIVLLYWCKITVAGKLLVMCMRPLGGWFT